MLCGKMEGISMKALQTLIELIEAGMEFPEAEYKVRALYKMSDSKWQDIVAQYDAI